MLGNQIVRATLARLEANRQEAITTIQLYISAVTGVADHPDVVNEVCEATAKLANAEKSIEALQRNFLRKDTDSDDNGE